jgi:hypothetical protein
MKIIGIVLVKNEDRFIEPVLRNIVDFCDELIVLDDYLTRDNTGKIVKTLMKDEPKIIYKKIIRLGTSHELIEKYAGTDTWIFAVDGDEIYDHDGLMRFRKRIEAGEFDKWWIVFGNVLNITKIDDELKTAEGYLAPPCRSMTKLYNFSAIDAWEGPCRERLHGGTIHFRPGFDASLRLDLHEKIGWDSADYRCLHACFVRRSSIDKDDESRLDIMDRAARPWWRRMLGINKEYVPWKLRKYQRGKLVHVDVSEFFKLVTLLNT